jgi:hypothetical protein
VGQAPGRRRGRGRDARPRRPPTGSTRRRRSRGLAILRVRC